MLLLMSTPQCQPPANAQRRYTFVETFQNAVYSALQKIPNLTDVQDKQTVENVHKMQDMQKQ